MSKVTPIRPNLRIPQDQADQALREREQQEGGRSRAPSRETFARIPHDKALALYRYQLSAAAYTVLFELDRAILKSGGRNPVQLWSARLRAAGICDHKRTRALGQLEAAGVISIKRQRNGLSPLITHLWYRRRD